MIKLRHLFLAAYLSSNIGILFGLTSPQKNIIRAHSLCQMGKVQIWKEGEFPMIIIQQ